MAMEYFCCYHSYLRKCEKLTDQELGRLFRSLLVYSSTGERQELAGRESIAFDFIADDIDRAKESYAEKCAANAQKGKLGGRPKKQELSEKAKKAVGFSESQKSQSEDKSKGEDKSKTEVSPLNPPDVAAVMSAYLNKINPSASQSSIDELRGYVEAMGPDVCLRAIDIALDAKAANWHYIRAILREKQSRGVRCLADWDALEGQWSRSKGNSGPSYDYSDTEGSL